MKKILSPNRLQVLKGLAVLAVLSLIPSLLALVEGKFPFDEDSLSLFAPWRVWTSQSLQAGTLPLWNPHLFGGMPFMSNGQASIFYPINIVYWVFPVHIALLLDAFFHSVLLGCGGYLLARSLSRTPSASWLCAICLMTGNGVASHLFAGHTTWHAARAYLPLIIWALVCFCRKRDIKYLWGLAVLMTLQVFAGYPPYVLWSVCWCLVFAAIWWRVGQQRSAPGHQTIKPLQFFLPALLLVLLSAAVVLPLRESSRQGRELTFESAVKPSSSVNGWVRLALPNFFGGNNHAQWSIARFPHEEAAYIGLLPLGLAMFAPVLWRWQRREEDAASSQEDGFHVQRFVNLLWWILPMSMIMALGKNTPIYQFLFDYFPPLRLFRVPARWFEIWYFAACVLAAFGFDALFKLESERLKRIATVLIGFFLLCLCITIVICISQPQWNYWMEVAQWNDRLSDNSASNRLAYAGYLRFNALQSIVTGCILALVLALVVNKIREAPNSQRAVWIRPLLAIVIVDLLMMFWMSARFTRDGLHQNPWAPRIVKHYQPGQRWNTAFEGESAAFGLNLGLPHSIDVLGGYDTMAPRSFFDFASAIEHRQFWSSGYQSQNYNPLWRVAGITHVPASASSPLLKQIKKHGAQLVTQVGSGEEAIGLWKMPDSWPRAYLTTQVMREPRAQQLSTLSLLAKRKAPAAVIGPTMLMDRTFSKDSQGKVNGLRPETNRTTVELETDGPQLLVLGEANAAGWRAWVNGREQKIETTNYLFRGVEVPQGRSKVVFAYDNQTHRIGVFLTLCGLALLTGALSFAYSNRQKRREE